MSPSNEYSDDESSITGSPISALSASPTVSSSTSSLTSLNGFNIAALTDEQKRQLLQRLMDSMNHEAIQQAEENSEAIREYQRQHPPAVRCLEKARIPTEFGDAFLYRYSSDIDDKEHVVWSYGFAPNSVSLSQRLDDENEDEFIIRGNYSNTLEINKEPKTVASHLRKYPLVRVHSECFTGDVMGSIRCDCGEQLTESKRQIAATGGVIVYLRQEGRNIGLGEKMKAYNIQDLGADTVLANQILGHAADARSFGLANAILEDLGLLEISLLTNNPTKIQSFGNIRVVDRVSMIPLSWQNINRGITSKELDKYMLTKQNRMGHMLAEAEAVAAPSQ